MYVAESGAVTRLALLAIAKMGTSLNFSTLDVFTDTPYEGNPLAIVHIPKGTDVNEKQKLKIAKEFNLSETVFLHEAGDASDARRFDIFTIIGEIPFAGHPTIGTLSYITMEAQSTASSIVKLQCKAGLIECHSDPQTKDVEAQVPHNFHLHSNPISSQDYLATQPSLARVLADSTEERKYPVVSFVSGMSYVMIELSSVEHELAAISPSTADIPSKETLIDNGWEQGLIGSYFFVTVGSPSQSVLSIRTRMIEHKIGEDPATGSAACSLACYLAHKDGNAGQTHGYEIEQGVEMGRRSLIRVRVKLDGNRDIKQVFLSGRAVRVMEGKLVV